MTNLLQVVKIALSRLHLLLLLVVFLFSSCRKAPTYEFDLIISNGNVIDGSGSLWFPADLAIKGKNIVEIGKIPNKEKRAPKIINAQDLIVCPGFINLQTNSNSFIFTDDFSKNKIYQGITSQVFVDGIPLRLTQDRKKLGIYFSELFNRGISINIGAYIGLNKIVESVLGSSKRKVNLSEISEIKKIIHENMIDGALGLSNSSDKLIKESMTPDELIALADVVAKYGGRYSAFVRGNKKEIQTAIRETVRVSKEANIPTDIVNLEVTDESFFGKIEEIIKVLDKHRESVELLTMTQAPYLARRDDASGVPSEMQEKDVIFVLKLDWVSIRSVGRNSNLNKGMISRKIHAESYGSFPLVLGKFVREKEISDLETVVKKMTWLNAKKLGLQNRGLIKIGNRADITIFNPNTVNGNGATKNPQEFSSGIQYVIVNGVLVLEAGKLLSSQPGQILLGKGKLKE